VPGDEDAITVDFVPGAPGSARLGLGRPSISHATSAGKVMLAFSGGSFRGSVRAYTPRTITDVSLASEIQDVLEHGYAQAIGEREPGLTAIAAPITRAAASSRRSSRSGATEFDATAVEAACHSCSSAQRGLRRARLAPGAGGS
jgi:DNA-binding IclR family transcriptional regulator